MGHWNHRVMRRVADGETFYSVYEVYYDDAGKVTGWTDEPASPLHCPEVDSEGSTMRTEIERFLRACDLPTLDWDTGKEIDDA